MVRKVKFDDQTFLFQMITENNKTAHASSSVSGFHMVVIIAATHPPAWISYYTWISFTLPHTHVKNSPPEALDSWLSYHEIAVWWQYLTFPSMESSQTGCITAFKSFHRRIIGNRDISADAI